MRGLAAVLLLGLLAGCGTSTGASTPAAEQGVADSMNQKFNDPDFQVEVVSCPKGQGYPATCSARVLTRNGVVAMPVTVTDKDWSIEGPDLAAAREGPAPKPGVTGDPIVALGGSGEKVQITFLGRSALSTDYPNPRAEYGNQYVAFRVKVENIGKDSYSGQLSYALSLADGQQIEPALLFEGDCRRDDLDSVVLRPKQSATGCVPFEVKDEAVLKRMLVKTDFSEHLLEWGL